MRSSALFLGAVVVAAATAVGAAPASTPFYEQTNLVSSDSDADLVNPWGLASSAASPWWVADNGRNLSTLYNSAGTKQQLKVTVPGAPTGLVFNSRALAAFGSSRTNNTGLKTGKAAFLFATESGTLLAWNPSGTATDAVVVARARRPGHQRDLQGTGDRHRSTRRTRGSTPRTSMADKVDVFDGRSHRDERERLRRFDVAESDTRPSASQVIGGTVFVTYAQQDEDAEDDVHGPGPRLRRRRTTRWDLPDARSPRGASSTRRGASRWRRQGWGAFGGSCSSATSATA